MRKIIEGMRIEKIVACCDFCGEDEKHCFRSPEVRKIYRTKYSLEILKKTVFSSGEYYRVQDKDGDCTIEEVYFDICTDCVKQLFGLSKPSSCCQENGVSGSIKAVLGELLKKEKSMTDLSTGGQVAAIKTKHIKRLLEHL